MFDRRGATEEQRITEFMRLISRGHITGDVLQVTDISRKRLKELFRENSELKERYYSEVERMNKVRAERGGIFPIDDTAIKSRNL